MAPGLSFKKQLHSTLKENLKLDIEFDEQQKEFKIKLMFKGYSEPIVQESIYLDHRHDVDEIDQYGYQTGNML